MILIIDNDPEFRSVLRRQLEPLSVSGIIEADSLQQAEPILRNARLVISDLLLPDGEGIEVLAWLRDRYPGPLVIISDVDDVELMVRCLHAGADNVLTKESLNDTSRLRDAVLLAYTRHSFWGRADLAATRIKAFSSRKDLGVNNG